MIAHTIGWMTLALTTACTGEGDKDPTGDDSAAQHSGEEHSGDDTGGPIPVDADGDGHASIESGGGDCDDTNASAHPGAIEDCSGSVDLDCDGHTGSDDGDCEHEHGPLQAYGYFVVGERSTDWDCLLYYVADGEFLWSSPDMCEGCDYALEIRSTYIEGAVERYYPECAWEDLTHWEEIEEFTTRWGFSLESGGSEASMVWYYAEPYAAWYPIAELTTGYYAYYDYYYWTWNWFAETDDAGNTEVGLWWFLFDYYGYLY